MLMYAEAVILASKLSRLLGPGGAPGGLGIRTRVFDHRQDLMTGPHPYNYIHTPISKADRK